MLSPIQSNTRTNQVPPWARDASRSRAETLHHRALDRGTSSRNYAGRLSGVTTDLDRPWHILTPNENLGQLHEAIDHAAGPAEAFPFDETQPYAFHIGQEFRVTLAGTEQFLTIVRPYTAYARRRYRIRVNNLEAALTQSQLQKLTGLNHGGVGTTPTLSDQHVAMPFRNVRWDLMNYTVKPWGEPHQPGHPAKPAQPAWIERMTHTIRFLNGQQQYPYPLGKPDPATTNLIKFLNRNCPNQKAGAAHTGSYPRSRQATKSS